MLAKQPKVHRESNCEWLLVVTVILSGNDELISNISSRAETNTNFRVQIV